MLIDYHREKLINAIIYFIKNTKHCGKTKLFKLLYFLDFLHFKETGSSVTGLDYYAWDFGPVPSDLFYEIQEPPEDLKASLYIQSKPELDDKSFTEIKARQKFDDRHFSKRELRILENVAYIFKEAKAEDMVDASHLPNHPWDKTVTTKGYKSRIDYFLALDDTSDSLSIEDVKERLRDREEIIKAFYAKRDNTLP